MNLQDMNTAAEADRESIIDIIKLSEKNIPKISLFLALIGIFFMSSGLINAFNFQNVKLFCASQVQKV